MTEAAPGSALATLRARRERKMQERTIDLQIPGLDPPMYVRMGVVGPARVEEIAAHWEKSDLPDKVERREAQIIAEGCRGLFEVVDGKPVSVDPDNRHGSWPTFGPDLAAMIGSDATTAEGVVLDVLGDGWLVVALSRKYGAWLETTVQERTDPGN